MNEYRETLLSRIRKITEQMRMIDMHAHLLFDGEEQKELDFRKKAGIVTCFSAGTPDEWQQLQKWRKREELLVSFGIHPWYADRFRVENCREYLESCDYIGEIGMDSVWCRVPSEIQQNVLEQQLQAAADLEKPVILHTKGQEKIIGDMIRDFPGKVCVHWYSGTEKDLERFLEKDCYFTLGPDFEDVCGNRPWKDREARSEVFREKTGQKEKAGYLRILKEVPPERLFVETDGITAVAWARNVQAVEMKEIPKVLWRNMEYTSKVHGCSAGETGLRMKKNLEEFLA